MVYPSGKYYLMRGKCNFDSQIRCYLVVHRLSDNENLNGKIPRFLYAIVNFTVHWN